MKKIYLLVLFIALNTIYAQPDSITEAMKYYPLDKGNYWEYYSAYGSDPFHYTLGSSYWLEVVGDSIFTNGKSYKIINKGYFGNKSISMIFERIDSIDASVYRFDVGKKTEYKIDSLLQKPGDSVNCSRFHPREMYSNYFRTSCISENEETLFNQKWITKKIDDNSIIPNIIYKLAKGLGYIFSEAWEGTYWGDRLSFARINGIEYGIKTDIVKSDQIPDQFKLFQNYPNPFNPSTTINYSIPYPSSPLKGEGPRVRSVTLKVYDLLGREIATLVNEEKLPGIHNVKFDGNNLPSGLYFYQLKTNEFIQTKKMILLK
jgi:hypothetical protein